MNPRYIRDEHTLRVVYDLLKRRGFPYCHAWDDALPLMRECRNYARFDEGRAVLWIGFHTFQNKTCAIDVCADGRWASKDLIKWVGDKVFHEWGCKALYADTGIKRWEESLLRFGFKRHYSTGMLVFTDEVFHKKFASVNG